ncbi:hypothetical protein Y032_0007g3304 [Ancylostoma ceylanicum]|nr:hypothetical protein Y032_0007g3304 [Ancylostoma ceylanicum]
MSKSTGGEGRLIWIDCEMTGLDVEKQTLVEIATIVTDKDLNVVAEGPDIVIHQSEKVLDVMEEWPRQTFIKNGLLKKIRESNITLERAEEMGESHRRRSTDARVYGLTAVTRPFHLRCTRHVDRSSRKILRKWMSASGARTSV